jgi:hypothetical protein
MQYFSNNKIGQNGSAELSNGISKLKNLKTLDLNL